MFLYMSHGVSDATRVLGSVATNRSNSSLSILSAECARMEDGRRFLGFNLLTDDSDGSIFSAFNQADMKGLYVTGSSSRVGFLKITSVKMVEDSALLTTQYFFPDAPSERIGTDSGKALYYGPQSIVREIVSAPSEVFVRAAAFHPSRPEMLAEIIVGIPANGSTAIGREFAERCANF